MTFPIVVPAKQDIPIPPMLKKGGRYSVAWWIGVAFAIIGIGGCLLVLRECARNETAFNVTSVDWLPRSATDISYHRDSIDLEYECKIPESDFRDLMRKQGVDLTEISEPVTVCYLAILREEKFDPNHPEHTPGLFNVTDGLYYELHDSSASMCLAVYDRSRGVGYYHWCPH